MISDSNSSPRSQNSVPAGDERTGPISYERIFECSGLMIRFERTVD